MGEGAVVRSDDVDGNYVIGEVWLDDAAWHFRVHCDDDGSVIGSELTPLEG